MQFIYITYANDIWKVILQFECVELQFNEFFLPVLSSNQSMLNHTAEANKPPAFMFNHPL